MSGGGEGALIRGGACLIFWPKKWALIREWTLIPGKTVHEKKILQFLRQNPN